MFVHPNAQSYAPRGIIGSTPDDNISMFDVTCTLATFDISECLGEDGDPIVPDVAYTLGWFRKYLVGEIVTDGSCPRWFWVRACCHLGPT